uniref:protein DA1-related 6-like isoform X2 n=1 Tax=Fragaria vesca subsp. vesca TaxID=101020 RepID=UPI0005CA4376|nr:PREDICTED: protein DA1-related 6-like isoform X2 [Fragaria vesca subsp. vesca]
MSPNDDSEEVKHDSYMASIFPPDCDTCFRSKEDGETGCLDLGDGRELCSDCSSIALKNSDECKFIIRSVFEFYKTEKLEVDKKIPILFVDKNQMKRLYRDDARGMFISSLWNCLKLSSSLSLSFRIMAIFVNFSYVEFKQ